MRADGRSPASSQKDKEFEVVTHSVQRLDHGVNERPTLLVTRRSECSPSVATPPPPSIETNASCMANARVVAVLAICPILWVLIGVAVLAASLLWRYTPLFNKVECSGGNWTFSQPVMNDSGIFIDVSASMLCQNPNLYSLEIWQERAGEVALVHNLTHLGTLDIPVYTMPSLASGTMNVSVSLGASMGQIYRLVDLDIFQVVLVLDMAGSADVEFLFAEITPTFNQAFMCGFEMQFSTLQFGPVACAASFDELHIPQVDTPKEGKFTFGPSSEQLKVYRRWFQLGCGSVIAACVLLAGVIIICFRRRLRCAPRRPQPNVQSEHTARVSESDAEQQPANGKSSLGTEIYL